MDKKWTLAHVASSNVPKNFLKFGTLNLKKVKVNGFKFIQEHSKHGSFRKKKTIILSLYMNCSISD